MNCRYCFLLVMFQILSACAVLPHPRTTMAPGAEAVRVASGAPGNDYEEVGVISATDGSGCGALGVRGNYENAEIELKNRAFAMGAEYVKIQSVTEPFASDGCYHNEVKIYGNAFRKTTGRAQVNAPPAEDRGEGPQVLQKLRDLKKLRDEKIITEEEFGRIKSELLDEAF